MSGREKTQLHGIITPHEHDVLSGRGNFVNYHTGNEHFRALVRKHKVAYVACPKPQKGKFSKMIVDEIRNRHPPGRFLKQDPATKLWYDIGEKKALDKTRQALREGAPDIMKEMTGDDDSVDDDETQPEPTPLQMQEGIVLPQIIPPAPDSISSPILSRGGQGGGGGEIPVQSMYSGSNGLSSLDGSNHQNPYDTYNNAAVARHLSMHGNEPSLVLSSHSGHQHQSMGPPLQLQQRNISSGMFKAAQAMAAGGGRGIHHSLTPQHVACQQQSQLTHPGMQMLSQQQDLSLQMPPPAGMNFHGQGFGGSNMRGGNYRGDSFDSLQSKLSKLPQSAYHGGGLEHYEPRPIDPHQIGNRLFQPDNDDNYDEPESVAPLRPRKVPLRGGIDRGKMERENSDRSLQIDNIFHGAAGGHGTHAKISLDKALDQGNTHGQPKFNGSSAHLSVMSLSISDMAEQGSTSQPPQMQATGSSDLANADSLGPLFSNSLRLGDDRSHRSQSNHSYLSLGSGVKQHLQKQPPRRTGSGDGNNSDLGHVLDMSVATLGDRMSDFGDMSLARMNGSEANMSFSNVFDETERDLYVNR